MDSFVRLSGKSTRIEDDSPGENELPGKRTCGRSFVWKHFQPVVGGSAKCLECKQVNKSGGNTTNLINHLKRAHPTLSITPKASKTMGSFFSLASTKAYALGSSRKAELDDALIRMVATDMQPFRIVEDTGFRNFVNCLDPRYNLPSRRTLSDVMLDNMYGEMKRKLHDLISNAKYCGITTDGWTSRANDHYLTVTCHFVSDDFILRSAVLATDKLVCDNNQTSENIAETLRKVLVQWNIQDKVTSIVTDNASSMIKACRLLEKRHLPCFAHTLNLIVQDALMIDSVKDVIAKCKRIVTFFKSSSIAYAKLKSAQGNESNYGLVQVVATRWNSCYKMISRILKIRDAVSRVLLDTKKAPPPLTADEIFILSDLADVLEPFEGATNRVSGSTYETISLIIPVSADIHHRLISMRNGFKTLEGIEISNALLDGISRRLFEYETRSVTKMATILDPRFKKEGFRSGSTADSAVEAVQNELAEMQKSSLSTLDSFEPPTHTESVAFFSFMEMKIANKVKTPRSDAIIALRQYLENPHASPNISPLEYWKTHATETDSLKECGLKYLCIPACSTESERTFSRAGCIVTDRRAALKPKNVDKLVFTSKNAWVLDIK